MLRAHGQAGEQEGTNIYNISDMNKRSNKNAEHQPQKCAVSALIITYPCLLCRVVLSEFLSMTFTLIFSPSWDFTSNLQG